MSRGAFVVAPFTNVIEAVDLAPGPFEANNPLIGYKTLVPDSSLNADYQDPDYPLSNLKNIFTTSLWKSTETYDQEIEIIFDSPSDVNYVGIARHNFFSAAVQVAIDVATVFDSVGVPQYNEQIAQTSVAADSPLLFRFNTFQAVAVRLRLFPSTEIPELAILFAGKLLVVERRLYVGHTPITYGREVNAVDVVSISGDYQGSVVIGQSRNTSVQISNLTPSWYRTNMEPFFEECHSNKSPFFWVWRPGTYPDEVGFVWITDDPRPSNVMPNGLMGFGMQIRGIV